MRTIVVTGSASGIGRATSQLLRERGDRVVGVDLHDADVTADLATVDGRAELADAVATVTGGALDAVVANAGLAHETPDTVSVNFFGMVATLESLRPLLAGSAAPRAALTASSATLLPTDAELVDLCLAGDEAGARARVEKLGEVGQGSVVYASSKLAVARWLRRHAAGPEWAGAGIPLNAIAPGIVKTPMTVGMTATERRREALAKQVPMPLHGYMEPEVPARLFAWLVSPDNSHLCGQVVYVDGGADVVLRGDTAW
jgi:NAD(P)-dependent dehydrogenase (short-subunit alcohol dehydrogenase family)